MAAQRSQSYPAFSLDFCIGLVSKIYTEYGTSTLLKREEIAEALGVTGATVQMRVSSSVQYGLLERSHGEGYKPSSLFINIYKPLSDHEKRNALIEALTNPPLYKKLLEEIDGSIVPSVKALSTILFRKHGISESASENASQTFIDNLNFVELIESDNHIRLKKGNDGNSEKNPSDGEYKNRLLIPTATLKMSSNPVDVMNFREINIPLTEKKKAILHVPADLNGKDIEIIKAQINVIALSIED